MERKLARKIFRKFRYASRGCPLLEILENAVPFATASCRKFKPHVLVKWKAPRGSVASSQPQARRVSFRISFHRLCTLLSWNLEQAVKMIVSVSGGSYSCISVFSV